MSETFKELAANWSSFHPDLRPWLDANKKGLCDAIGLWTDADELLVILMRLSNPDEWPEAGQWTGFKGDLGRARDKVLRPFMEGEDVDPEELRIAVRMIVGQFNQACEKIYYMKKALGNHRRR